MGLLVQGDLARSRLTVFFRLLLALPHLIWLTLWSLVTYVVAIVNWLVTLVRGISPQPLHRFLAAYVRYQAHVYGYLALISTPFPGFTGRQGSYPIEVTIAPPVRQSRLKVFGRLILAIPALLINSAYGGLLFTVGFLGWFSALARGCMPLGMRNAGALALRYEAQLSGYLLLLTESYPYSGPVAQSGAPGSAVPPVSPLTGADPLAEPPFGSNPLSG